MADYTSIFFVCLFLNVVVTLRSSGLYPLIRAKFWGPVSAASSDSASSSLVAAEKTAKQIHRSLLTRYLAVYLLGTLSDWLQGPYVYALYDAYGFSQHDIAVLFVAGFGSSMIFGSFVGGLADSCGRRKFVVLYCIIYAASCATKHFNEYYILFLGRILGGIATSLLFSVFDSWLIRSHDNAGVDKSLLGTSFSSASYGNSISAIVAGLIANRLAAFNELLPYSGVKSEGDVDVGGIGSILSFGGYVNPFDASFVALCICAVAALALWEENYGDQRRDDGDHSRRDEGCSGSWRRATSAVFQNREILLCGAISSLFEGSMYVFVFMWTPALTGLTAPSSETSEEGDSSVSLPFGLIFSTFMVCCMLGSSTFSVAMEKGIKGEALGVIIFAISALSMMTVTLAPSDTVAFLAMNTFEVCVGMYWPTMGTMKGNIVPESSRAAIYNLFRIPLNFIVLLSLLTHLTPTQSFVVCTMMLFTASLLQFRLMQLRSVSSKQYASVPKDEIVDNADGTPVKESKVVQV